MKKYGLIVLGVSLLLTAGCTKPEEEEQIRSFWQKQLGQLFLERMPQFTKTVLPGMSNEEKAARKAAADELFSAQALANRAMQESAVPVLLFVNPRNSACVKMKEDRWTERFQGQYGKKVNLTVYDVTTPQGVSTMHQFLLSRELPKIAVPTLVIGETIFQNYPFKEVDPALQPLLASLSAAQEEKSEARSNKRRPNQTGKNQYIEITMEDGANSVLKSNVKASAKDRAKIQQAFEATQQENQRAISDIGRMFGDNTQAKAFEIVSNNEQKLRKSAASSRTLTAYLTAQKRILAEQEQQLAQLMQQSVKAGRSRRRAQ